MPTIRINTSTEQVLLAGAALHNVRLTAINLIAQDDVTVEIQDEDDVALAGPYSLPADGRGFVLPPNDKGWAQAAAGKGMKLVVTGAAVVGGSCNVSHEK